MAEQGKKPKTDAGTEKKATKTLKVELTPQEHAFVGLAANLCDQTTAEYLSRVVAEAAMRDTQNTEKIRAEVNEGLKARRK